MSKKNPLISIIIPTKNEENNIVNCLASVKRQKLDGIAETIVVDNFSTDKTAQLARKLAIKVVLSGNERSAQRNVGARLAKGKWLFFVDADMELSKGLLSECLNLCKLTPAPPAIIVNERAVGYTFLGRAFALERNCYQDASWLQSARLFPKKHFLQLGGYDKTLFAGEDWDITARFREKGFPIFITKNSYLIHHESKRGLIDSYKKDLYYIRNIHRYAKKQPLAFSYQGSFLYRALTWARSWNKLAANPLLTLTFLTYKFSVWILWILKKNGAFQSRLVNR